MRIDKYLADCNIATRSEIKKLIKQKRVTINEQLVKTAKTQVDETSDIVQFDGQTVSYQKAYYYLLNKPAGILSATRDLSQVTVLDLLDDEDYRADLFPVGRLDKDTTGLLMISNDGKLSHQLLSPKKHVQKQYYAAIEGIVTAETVEAFAQPMTLKDGLVTKPAKLEILTVDEANNTSEILVTIAEGKYHQVRRMFAANDLHVAALKRIKMGNLTLPDDLAEGEYRPMTTAELALIQQSE